jgi:phage baseplate assembly protein W
MKTHRHTRKKTSLLPQDFMTQPFLGIDLAVAPNLVAYDAAALDLVTERRPIRGKLVGPAQEAFDLKTLSDRENLAQALLLRLLTPVGSLADLGHASYGSRLHELLGERKTSALRNLCRAYVLEVVAQEPRVENTAVELTFAPEAEPIDAFVFTLAVQPVSADAPLVLSLEVGL